MAAFTVLTKELVRQIIGNYPVGSLGEFKPLAGGLANSSMKVVTDTGVYVLSVCDEKDFSEISRLCALLNYLDEAGFPTTRVISTHDGATHLDHTGKPAYLKQYISGEVVSPLDTHQLYDVGKMLARLHAIPPHGALLDHFSYGIESFPELAHLSGSSAYVKWLMERKPHIESARLDSLPKGFVHGDLFFDNMLFVDGALAAILDFEEACNYFLVFDIGMSAVGCCVVDGCFSLDLTAALVAGYQEIRPLEPVECAVLQRFVEYGAVATSFWRYRQYNVRNPDKEMKDHYRFMEACARQVAQIDPDLFIESVFG